MKRSSRRRTKECLCASVSVNLSPSVFFYVFLSLCVSGQTTMSFFLNSPYTTKTVSFPFGSVARRMLLLNWSYCHSLPLGTSTLQLSGIQTQKRYHHNHHHHHHRCCCFMPEVYSSKIA